MTAIVFELRLHEGKQTKSESVARSILLREMHRSEDDMKVVVGAASCRHSATLPKNGVANIRETLSGCL
jgi:hypothetical protein